MLKVDDPMGTDIHLLLSDVEKLPGAIQPMLSPIKVMIRYLPLAVLLEGGSVPLRRTAFSCLGLSSSCEVAMSCSPYAARRICCYMLVLAVLCWRLNKYYAYLANEVIPT
jgi:hypothetical protein